MNENASLVILNKPLKSLTNPCWIWMLGLLVLAILWAASLSAAPVAGSSSGIFLNPVPNTAVVSGIGTSSFTWGTPTFGTPPSSLNFAGTPFTANCSATPSQ